MIALGYVRVSTQGQVDHGLSLEAQRAKITSYCRTYDLELTDILTDEGKSAKSLNGRPAMARLLTSVQHRLVDAVVCYKLDRMFRSLKDGLETLALLESHHVAFHSVSEQWNTSTAAGEFALNMVLALAQLERRQIGERTRETLHATKQSPGGTPILDHRRDAGKLIVGQAPYGFLWSRGHRGKRRLLPCLEEMEVVHHILDLDVGGFKPQAISAQLNNVGWRTRHGGLWTAVQIRRILARDFYEETK